jgi:hypothetical protein
LFDFLGPIIPLNMAPWTTFIDALLRLINILSFEVEH